MLTNSMIVVHSNWSVLKSGQVRHCHLGKDELRNSSTHTKYKLYCLQHKIKCFQMIVFMIHMVWMTSLLRIECYSKIEWNIFVMWNTVIADEYTWMSYTPICILTNKEAWKKKSFTHVVSNSWMRGGYNKNKIMIYELGCCLDWVVTQTPS